MNDPKTVLRYPQVQAEALADWRFFLMKLHARFRTGSFVKGLELVTRITEAAEEADHHPDVVLTYPRVDVDLHSHDVHGVTSRDIELARRISAIAAELGIEAAPREVSTLELALDVPDGEVVKPFWATVLGYDDEAYHQVEDPGGRNNALWFQEAPDATGRCSSGSTSTSSSRARSPRSGWPPRSRRAGRWSPTSTRRRSGCWPTPTATRSACAPRTGGSPPPSDTG